MANVAVIGAGSWGIALAKKYEVDMPIIEEVNQVLFADKTAKEAVNDLMLRDKKMEHSNLDWED